MGRKCEKGKPCGATCIERLDTCRKDFPDVTSDQFSKVSKKVSEGSDKPLAVEEGKEYLKGERVDINELNKKAAQWRERAGLIGGDSAHDNIHILLHEFLGGEDNIAKLVGVKGKSPTVAEEYFATMLENDAMGRLNNGNNFSLTKDVAVNLISLYFNVFNSHGKIPSDEVSTYRDFGKIADIYGQMQKDPRFDKLIEAAQAVISTI